MFAAVGCVGLENLEASSHIWSRILLLVALCFVLLEAVCSRQGLKSARLVGGEKSDKPKVSAFNG